LRKQIEKINKAVWKPFDGSTLDYVLLLTGYAMLLFIIREAIL
tara:strand:+ start:398 stop:526 length:129 start_codon:yes stop_codon:yes gene_type:complete